MAPCCAPGCKSNYQGYKKTGGEYVTSFKFPSDKELRQKWINLVPRQDWKCTKNSVLCVKHFRVEDVIDCVVFTDLDGSTQSVKSEKITLKKGAVPSIWPGMPAFVNVTESKKSKCHTVTSATKILDTFVAGVNGFLESDAIEDYSDFLINYKSKLSDDFCLHWSVISNNSCTVFFVLDIKHIPKVRVSIKVELDLSVSVFVEQAREEQITWIVPNGKLERWFQIENLLSRYSNIENCNLDADVRDGEFVI